jgi:chromosome segregation ATPase
VKFPSNKEGYAMDANEIIALDKEVKILQSKRDDLNSTVNDLSAQKITYIQEHGELISTISNLRADIVEITSELDKLKAEKQGILDEQKQAQELSQAEQAKNSAILVEIEKQREDIDSKIADLRDRESMLADRVISFKSEVDQHNAAKEDLKTAQIDLSVRLNEVDKNIKSLAEKKQSLEQRSDDLNAEMEKVKAMKEQYDSKITEVDKKSSDLEQQKYMIEIKEKDLASLRVSLQKQYDDAAQAQKNFEDKKAKLDAAFASLESQKNELEVKRLRMEKLIRDKDIKAEIEAFNNELGK